MPTKDSQGQHIRRGRVFVLDRGDATHVISESYFYKTEAYYAIVTNENKGRMTVPKSSDVIEAYTVPICLSRARKVGIPACDWVVSYSYVSYPSIIYGLNYFSDPSDYAVVNDQETGRESVRHITNNGKYPFCYQPLVEPFEMVNCVSVLGKAKTYDEEVMRLSKSIHECFGLPVVNINLVLMEGQYRLSSLTPARYSDITSEDMELLGLPKEEHGNG